MDEKCRHCPVVAGIKKVLEDLRKNERTVFAWSAIWDKLKEFGPLLSLFLALVLGSCTTTKYVEVEKVHTDTLYISKMQKDSIYLHDSIFVNQWRNGDTIYQTRDRWRTEWRDRLVTDTVIHVITDTIPIPYPVEKVVEKELTWWQRVRLTLGDIALILGGIIVLAFIVKESILRSVRG